MSIKTAEVIKETNRDQCSVSFFIQVFKIQAVDVYEFYLVSWYSEILFEY